MNSRAFVIASDRAGFAFLSFQRPCILFMRGKAIPAGQSLLLLSVELTGEDEGLLAGDAAEGHDVGLSVAAEAVAAMDAARADADRLETLTDKSYWPYPTYSDLLFYV